MKKFFYLFAAAAAMMLTACSSEEVTNDVRQTPKEAVPMAIDFETYTSNATRSGKTGVMTTSTLQDPTVGFGVFAYQTTNTLPTPNDAKPNFMYNEKVTYSSAVWNYSPLKYWPNNTLADQYSATGHATSTPVDYVTFFAYAPYVDFSTSLTTPGISAVVPAATGTGDPQLTYTVATKPSESVDLLWAVTPDAWSYKNVKGDVWNSTGSLNGLPMSNLLKPDVNTKIKFMFNHALARLGLNVIAAVDQEAAGGYLDADETRIVIESVTVTDATSTPNLAPWGMLNLNNTTANKALWSYAIISTPLSFSITNTTAGEMESSLWWDTNAATSFGKEGVLTTKEKPLIANGNYFMIIPPASATTLKVDIVYHVITKDTKLDGSYSDVKNSISKNVSVTFENGKAYTLKLILGLTSVKLDAVVQAWEAAAATPVDLPQNKE